MVIEEKPTPRNPSNQMRFCTGQNRGREKTLGVLELSDRLAQPYGESWIEPFRHPPTVHLRNRIRLSIPKRCGNISNRPTTRIRLYWLEPCHRDLWFPHD